MPMTKKNFAYTLTVTLLVLMTVPASGQSGQSSSLTAAAAARFLDQATWGPTSASIAQLQQMGIDGWLASQFALKTSDIPDQPIATRAGQSNNDIRPVDQAFIQNTVTGPDQLRQRVAFALSEIWVVSQQSGVPQAYAYPPYWRIFRDNAFGNYRDIVQAVTLNPAMGRYLNMANNNKADPVLGTAANENYARELMQLFTVGLVQLNSDGSPVLDSNHQPVPTLASGVVTGTSKALTGWTYPTAPGQPVRPNNPAYYFGQMFAVQSEHDTSAKTIISGVNIPAGQTAEQDLATVIDTLMQQPTMAPFISQQLIEHLVTSNPSAGYIGRVSNVFLNNGSGVRGDMKAVITAILTDTEARAGDDPTAPVSPNFGHLREPVLFTANVLRGLNARLTSQSTLFNITALLNQNLFNEPSVFSFFSPQYHIPKGLLGPEFQIYSTQTAVDRANVVAAVVFANLDAGTTTDLSPFTAVAGDTTALLNYIGSIFLHGSMSKNLQMAATDAVNAIPFSSGTGRGGGGSTSGLARAQTALYVVLTSGEYQVIH
jgi:uncharacterized protein (DUF1800 family)